MNKTLRTRLRVLERTTADAERRDRHGSRDVLALICRSMLAFEPDLALVEACDTDDETFLDLQVSRARARGDHAEVERLKVTASATPPSPKVRPSTPCGTLDRQAAMRQRMERVFAEARRSSDSMSRAIDAARVRLGMSVGPEHSVAV